MDVNIKRIEDREVVTVARELVEIIVILPEAIDKQEGLREHVGDVPEGCRVVTIVKTGGRYNPPVFLNDDTPVLQMRQLVTAIPEQ